MKAIDQYFPVVLFIMLYKVVLTFESVDEILKCDHSCGNCALCSTGNGSYYQKLHDKDMDLTKGFSCIKR